MDYKLTFKEYNQALKKNKLMGLKCKECNTITVPPKMVCRKCASLDIEALEVRGNGKIRTFATVYVGAEGRQGECPYTIVLVELDDGPWIMGYLLSKRQRWQRYLPLRWPCLLLPKPCRYMGDTAI